MTSVENKKRTFAFILGGLCGVCTLKFFVGANTLLILLTIVIFGVAVAFIHLGGTKQKEQSNKQIADYEKDATSVISELNLEKKAPQKTLGELKIMALELLYIGSLQIRYMARSLSINDRFIIEKNFYIIELSNGMCDLPDLISCIEDPDRKRPYHTKERLEYEIIKCIRSLLVVKNAQPSFNTIDDFLSKHF